MRRTVLISVFILGFILLLTLHAVAQNKVVVIPLFGDDQQAFNNPAPVEKTGQTTSYATGDDGDLEKGTDWPNPRFTDNGDGTVTDNLTGLIWLRNANCFGGRSWANALSDCNGLANGSCGLTDGSKAGDWRLPNVDELQSLMHYGVYSPAVPNTAGTGKWTESDAFSGVLSSTYWSSTTYAGNSNEAWELYIHFGSVLNISKGVANYVWPVRSGK